MSELQVSREISSDFTIRLLKFLHFVENGASQANVLTNFGLGKTYVKQSRAVLTFFNNPKM